MAARLFYMPFRPAFDANMKTIPGAQAWFTLPGTNTPTPVYTDVGLTTADANPIVANAVGRFPIVYMDDAITYRVRIYDEDATVGVDTPLEDYDPYIPIDATVAGETLTEEDLQNRFVTILDFNPTGDGVADDSAAFASAEGATAADTPVFITPGLFRIAADMTIARRLIFVGGRLVIPNGVTVTLSGGVSAGPVQIFAASGTGKVVFDWNKTHEGYMEWWGGKADQSADCYAPFMAATEALLTTLHVGGHYQFENTPRLLWHNRKLIGAGVRYRGGSMKEVTRYLINSATQYGLQVGPDAEPAGGINDFQQGNEVRDIYVSRMIAPTIAGAAVGIRNQYTLGAYFERVKAAENMVDWHFFGSVATKCIDCEASRSVAGTGAGTDYWRGFWADGGAEIGAAGGNASLYLTRPLWSCNIGALQTGDSRGFYCNADFTDIFLSQPEGVNCNYDIYVMGNGAAGLDVGNADLRIHMGTFDQFHEAAIYIESVGATGIVQISDFYMGPSADARAGLWVNNCAGTIKVNGGEIDCHTAGSTQPIIIEDSGSGQIRDVSILECGNVYPAVGVDTCSNWLIAPTIKNEANTGQVAIQVTGTVTACKFEPMIEGKASAFTKGIDVTGTADARNLYELSGIDSACINGGSGNKLVRNAVQITAVGTTGTNYVSGVVA